MQVCHGCGRRGKDFRLCSGCDAALYCSAVCYLKDKAHHRTGCYDLFRKRVSELGALFPLFPLSSEDIVHLRRFLARLPRPVAALVARLPQPPLPRVQIIELDDVESATAVLKGVVGGEAIKEQILRESFMAYAELKLDAETRDLTLERNHALWCMVTIMAVVDPSGAPYMLLRP